MGLGQYSPFLLYLPKHFLFIFIVGNLASFAGFVTAFNSDWEILFIWSFAICLLLHIYWFSSVAGRLFNKWVNDYKVPLTIGFILVFFIELVSVAIRTFSLTTRLAINTFSGSLYLIILDKLVFNTFFTTPSVILNFFGFSIVFYLIIVISSELIKITGQCLLFVSLGFYYISEYKI